MPVTQKKLLRISLQIACHITRYRHLRDLRLSAPKSDSYPIAILCGGSSSAGDVQSIIHFHRYFLQEFLDLNTGVITLEQRGVDGNEVDVKEFMEHYTRSN